MEMNKLEKFFVNSPFRAFTQNVPTYFFRKHSGLPKKPFCLEIGCGQGAGIKIILNKFKASRVIGMDFDPDQIELARKKMGLPYRDDYSLFIGSAAEIGLAAAKFDAVFDYAVLHHIPAWRHALVEIYRTLKPRGYFFYEELLDELLKSYVFIRCFPHPHQALFTREQFEATLKEVGFNICWSRGWTDNYVIGVAQKP